jgi:hypothetical protein
LPAWHGYRLKRTTRCAVEAHLAQFFKKRSKIEGAVTDQDCGEPSLQLSRFGGDTLISNPRYCGWIALADVYVHL